jgi:hypothetical protein
MCADNKASILSQVAEYSRRLNSWWMKKLKDLIKKSINGYKHMNLLMI